MNRNNSNQYPNFMALMRQRPRAWADIAGSARYPEIRGRVHFHQTTFGVLVVTEVMGLPKTFGRCESPVFAFHIHEGNQCSGNADDPFANVRAHYNPHNCRHPYHAGDLPPLFGADGYAFSASLTNRFDVDQIVGKTVIIHASPDDFMTQPAGNAGVKMACGEIRR